MRRQEPAQSPLGGLLSECFFSPQSPIICCTTYPTTPARRNIIRPRLCRCSKLRAWDGVRIKQRQNESSQAEEREIRLLCMRYHHTQGRCDTHRTHQRRCQLFQASRRVENAMADKGSRCSRHKNAWLCRYHREDRIPVHRRRRSTLRQKLEVDCI